MSRIFYSMAGEGRGHAARVGAVVESLRRRHEITLFAPGDAYDLLAPAYAGTEVRVFRIPGLRFHYTASHSLDPVRTIREGAGYLWRFRRLVRRIKRELREAAADLVITDFEPALPRAADECGIPCVSLDHQHFLVCNDLAGLPRRLRWKARAMGWVVEFFCPNPSSVIVSSFYNPPLLPEHRGVTQVGVLLRPAILAARPEVGGHVVAYLRRQVDSRVLEALSRCGRPVHVYGLGERPAHGGLEFRPVSQRGFLDDLASCDSVVCTAGNQLVGEALYLGKPVLGLPETGNFEQAINAHFLRESGAGTWADPLTITDRDVREFLARRAEFAARIVPENVVGNGKVVAELERWLPAETPPARADGCVPEDLLEPEDEWETPPWEARELVAS
jgi:uncharacterized protein (TIGR00661 family)